MLEVGIISRPASLTSGVIKPISLFLYKSEFFFDVIPINKTLFLLADSYENIGRYKQALNHLDRLSSANDDEYSDLILFKKGIIYRNIGMVMQAQKAFQDLVKLFPNSKFKIFAEEEIQNI